MKIKMLIMDVDGTLTDGKIYYTSDNMEFKAFDVKDGYAIKNILPKYNIIPVIITGRKSEIVIRRAQELGITELYQGIVDKLPLVFELANKYHLEKEEIAYIGDDILDIECMKYCGYSGCPIDAVNEVLQTVDFISQNPGGDGAVREFVEKIIQRNKM